MCSDQKDARVDLLEMKSYSEIDLDDTPIVVLGCGHFFTAETLDGHVGMTEVYTTDRCGEFVGLQDISAVLAWSIPRCPDCQCPVRQYATQRYNRVINRAVIDEMSKRFLVNGQIGLHQLEQQIEELEQILEDSRAKITRSNQQALAHFTKDPTHAKTLEISKQLAERHNKSKKLKKDIESFCNKVADKHQPAQKLHDATVHASRKISIDGLMADLNVSASVPVAACDRQITFGGRIAQIKIEYIILSDKFNISQTLRSTPAGSSIKIPGGDPDQLVKPFLQTSKTLFEDCNSEKLPKFAVEVSVYYARIARLFESYCRSTHKNVDKAQGHVEVAKGLLDEARQLCVMKFQNVEVLRKAVEDSMQAFRKEWYEEVTAEELTSVKNAMVGGPQGIATRSGHWYNCENGHPFAIGECGMPMELARCPECGAPVGGRNHSAVAGVTRATNMEA
ncbi:MAG: hypothetical protein M1834_002682 [Cirrosporium novae-zelandiae]|nr:MAG: hypothetical protein M1834_002682 [Cirrosporium novae-zelandiae]